MATQASWALKSRDLKTEVVAGPVSRRLRLAGPQYWHLWLYGFVLVWWAASWNLRLSVLMAWMPGEPVVLASVCLAVCAVHRLGQRVSVPPAAIAPLVVLMLGFLPGALRSGGSGYAPDKVATLTLVVLPVVLASSLLLDSRAARGRWVAAQASVGLAVTVATSLTGRTTPQETGRLSLPTVDTISTSRFIGVAVVVLLLVAATSWRRAWWALPIAAGCGMVLVQVGSRGPLLFALASVVMVVVAARAFAGRRALLLIVVVAVAVAGYVYAQIDGGSGGERVVTSLRDGLVDDARAQLLTDAVRAGTAHPLGVGWGNFLDYSPIARSIANAQGVSYAHNAFAEAFSEGGVLALVAFGLFVSVALVRIWRSSGCWIDSLMLGTTLYWLLDAMVSSDFVGNRFMWISLAAAVACRASTKPTIAYDPLVPNGGSAIARRDKAV